MDVFSLVGKITVNYSDAIDDIDKVSKSANEAADSLEKVDKQADGAEGSIKNAGESAVTADSGFSVWKGTLANLASTVITKVIDGCAQLAGKMAELTASAVSQYAEYEQLAGGAQLMFGNAYDYIAEKAENAYKTVQLSQNDYLEQVNGLAVGLKTALGGNEQAAAELADRIITAEADIVAATGNTQENVQNAFNGIMKSNYTMLDNLSLGITPTKEGFQEVIDKVNEWKAANGDATRYNIENLADCQSALVDYIEMQGLSGYAAGEAATTIQGSWSSVQSLFENILTKVGGELAPVILNFLSQLAGWMDTIDWNAFATSVGDAFQRVFDWIQQIDFTTFFQAAMDGIQGFISVLAGLIEKLPGIVQSFEDWAPVIAGVTAAFVTLKGALTIATMVETLSAAWKAYKLTTEAATVAQTGYNIALNACPVILIVTLIAGLVAAIITLWNTNDGFREAVTNAWNKIKEVVGTVVDGIVNFFTGLVESVKTAWENIKTAISEKIQAIKETISNVFTAIADVVTTVWDTIKNAVQVAIMFIGEIFSTAFQIITMPWLFVWENCKEYVFAAWEYIKNAVSTALEAISTAISNVWNAIVEFLTPILEGIKNTFVTIWDAIKTTISTVWDAIKNVISTVIETIKTIISNAFNTIKTTISTILEGIKSVFTSIWDGIKTKITTVIDGVKSTISAGLNAAKSVVSTVLDGIKSKFSTIFEGAKNIVSGAINKIKSFFNFSWSLPKLKLPHISIKGSFSLTPPSVPHFGIDWYKKAMDDGMIMNQPTIFGYNAKSNQFLAGGEAGSETVVGTNSLMDMIRLAVDEENASLLEKFERILAILESYLPYIPELSHLQLVTDTGILAGELAPAMNEELGRIFEREGR